MPAQRNLSVDDRYSDSSSNYEEDYNLVQSRREHERLNNRADSQWEWVYYNAIDCQECPQQQQNGLDANLGEVIEAECENQAYEFYDDDDDENKALGSEYVQEWEYYDEMPASDEEFYYDPVLKEDIPQESMLEHEMLEAQLGAATKTKKRR